ncbi:tetratricopeptide repeat protein [Deinococcus sedimenti]|uniref:Tetratricopeptide repeat protein n=1 Tax=Deinococcus sedimenti TaxID=1867090 RepID=A0ABQ2S687_9DEIO|nr:tetratricopeptide repeat protein [Deinococcus sedimenti]GGR93177.1 hypothetical protein GCM10008960_20190 [Deinococcus sedimenti]
MTTLPVPWPIGVALAALTAVPLVQATRDLRSDHELRRAAALQGTLDFDPALRALREATRLNPSDPRAHLKLGLATRTLWFYRRTPQLKNEADTAFQRATQLSPSWPSPYYEYSLMYAFVKDYPRALTILQGALDRDPNNAAYWLQKGTYQELGRDVTGARASYERCLILNSTVQECRDNLKALPVTP